MTEITHVIPGPGKYFHGVDEKMTELYRSIDPILPMMVRMHWGDGTQAAKVVEERMWGLMYEAGLVKGERRWDPFSARDNQAYFRFTHLHNGVYEDTEPYMTWAQCWDPANAIPVCNMVGPTPPITLKEARARGMDWGRECRTKLGIPHDGESPLARVDQKFRNRCYKHVLACETCQHEGVAKCHVFPLIATGKVESDVDPKLDKLLKG